MPKRLSPEQIAQFENDGFLSPISLFPESKAAELDDAQPLDLPDMTALGTDERDLVEDLLLGAVA